MTKKHYLLLIFFAVLSLNIALAFVFSPWTVSSDSVGYFETARLIGGESAEIFPERILKPAGPALAHLFSLFGGISSVMDFDIASLDYGEDNSKTNYGVEAGFTFQNLFFYILSAGVVSVIFYEFFSRVDLSVLGSIFYLSSYPVLEYGLAAYMTDMSGWFFFLLLVYLGILYLKRPSWTVAGISGIVSFVGLLFKETTAAGIIFFVLVLIFSKALRAQKFKNMVLFLGAFFIPTIVWQIYAYLQFDASYFSWYLGRNAPHSYSFIDSFFFIKSLVATSFLGWILVFFGVKNFGRLGLLARKALYLLLIPSFSFLLWGSISSRVFYVNGLLLAVLMVWGFANMKSRAFAWSLSCLAVVFNYFWLVYDDSLRSIIF